MRWGYRRLEIAALAAVLLSSLALTACASSSSTSSLVGDVLSGVTNSISTSVQNSATTGSYALTSAVDQAEVVAYSLENYLSPDLDQPVSKVSGDISAALTQAQALATSVSEGSASLVAQITTSSQQLLNDIPASNKNPQISTYTPHFSTPGQAVTITASGNFAAANQKQQHPTLTYGGQSYTATDLEAQQIGFALPASIFTNNSNQIVSLSFQVDVAYSSGAAFKSIQPGQFFLPVQVLPANPTQSVTLTTQVTTTGTATKQLTAPVGADHGGPTFSENSFDCHEHEQAEHAYPEAGWTIRSAVPVVVSEKNSQSVHLTSQSVGPSGASFEYDTVPACFLGICNGCGEVYWYISYTEQQTISSTTPKQQTLNLPWGSLESFPVTNGWSIQIVLFNGAVLSCTDTCSDSGGFVNVSNHGNQSITVAADVPGGLQ